MGTCNSYLWKGDGEVEITVDANETSEERSTTIDVSTSILNKILTIIQKRGDMTNIVLFDFGIVKVYDDLGDSTYIQYFYLNNVESNYNDIKDLIDSAENNYPLFFVKFNYASGSKVTNEYIVPAYIHKFMQSGSPAYEFYGEFEASAGHKHKFNYILSSTGMIEFSAAPVINTYILNANFELPTTNVLNPVDCHMDYTANGIYSDSGIALFTKLFADYSAGYTPIVTLHNSANNFNVNLNIVEVFPQSFIRLTGTFETTDSFGIWLYSILVEISYTENSYFTVGIKRYAIS